VFCPVFTNTTIWMAEKVVMQVSTDISGHCGYEGDRHNDCKLVHVFPHTPNIP